MTVRFFVLATVASVAFADTVIGTVATIGHNQLGLKTPEGEVQVRTDEKTVVRKGKVFRDLSPLAAGDAVRVNYYGERGGTMVAVDILVRITLVGAIREAGSSRLVVLPDGTSGAGAKQGVFVFLSAETKLGLRRKEMTAGRRVRVTGWDVGTGVLDAEEIVGDDVPPPATRHPG